MHSVSMAKNFEVKNFSAELTPAFIPCNYQKEDHEKDDEKCVQKQKVNYNPYTTREKAWWNRSTSSIIFTPEWPKDWNDSRLSEQGSSVSMHNANNSRYAKYKQGMDKIRLNFNINHYSNYAPATLTNDSVLINYVIPNVTPGNKNATILLSDLK